MALRWPDKKVALDIIDGPRHDRFDGDETEWTVIHVTNAELNDYHSCRRIMGDISRLLGSTAHERPTWDDDAHRISDAFAARIA